MTDKREIEMEMGRGGEEKEKRKTENMSKRKTTPISPPPPSSTCLVSIEIYENTHREIQRTKQNRYEDTFDTFDTFEKGYDDVAIGDQRNV